MIDLDQHVHRIAAGDASAFAAWLAGAERPLRASLHTFAAAVDVEAVVQEALLRVWQVAPRYRADGRPNGLFRLAVRIARNLAVSEARRRRATPMEAEELARAAERDDDAPLDLPGDPFLRAIIARCREGLPARPAKALSARLESSGAQSDDALAESLGMRKNTFLQNFGRARKLLAECLGKNGVDLAGEMG